MNFKHIASGLLFLTMMASCADEQIEQDELGAAKTRVAEEGAPSQHHAVAIEGEEAVQQRRQEAAAEKAKTLQETGNY
ncbi:hypothetical protein EDC56_0208 [Sinobacterium caligoides]|uniref:Secreted protein n=1 Tax=Sinobacterium caligoides TaxID=933926 RepID=A0A3N2DZF7_9GAMM|nr:hypothetical protein [Sinobacterium caligoides]ROS04695.1 hypothetical protein EDC56_0208 [Sinobacterium caligoides]